MKQTLDTELHPLTSEMAISLVQSQQSGGGAIKRSVDDMLLDSLRTARHGDAVSPRSKSPMSVLTNHSPYKLSSAFLSPVAMTTAATSTQPTTCEDDIPTLKRARLDDEDAVRTPEKLTANELLRGGGLLGAHALPCTWLESASSPLRHSDSVMTSYSTSPTSGSVTSPGSDKPVTSSPPQLPPVLPPLRAPLPASLPAHLLADSPSRSSDGEMSVENTDPNAADVEGHEVSRTYAPPG